MLKRKITKETYDELPEAVKSEYKQQGDSYVLDVEDDDLNGLRKKVDELLDEKKKAQQKAREAEEAAAKKSGDVEALEASWKMKHKEVEDQMRSQLDATQGVIRSLTIEATASRIASELAVQGSSKALLPHVISRLDLEMVDGKPNVRVLDSQGRPTALTVEDLSKEIAADAALAPIIASSRASGGGASGGSRSGGSGKALKDMSDAERTEFFRRDPEGFRAAVAASKQPH